MKIEEIKVGMVFKDNDKRTPNRWLKIDKVDPQFNTVYFASSKIEGNFGIGAINQKSRRPERFHYSKKSKGYSLVNQEAMVGT